MTAAEARFVSDPASETVHLGAVGPVRVAYKPDGGVAFGGRPVVQIYELGEFETVQIPADDLAEFADILRYASVFHDQRRKRELRRPASVDDALRAVDDGGAQLDGTLWRAI